ncbi:MAG TPA: hypothetical protein VJZ27_01935, partial [Aggregatilineales bacterium]|nr:hypothetical protein [Aggregatilineales bacterium]
MSNRNSQRGHIIEPRNEVPRLVVLIFGIAGLVAIITSISLFSPRILDLFRSSETLHTNATWITRAWTQEDRPVSEIATAVEILEDNNIHKVYIQTHVWHGQTGEFIELPYSNNFVQRFRKHTTTIELYIWLSIDQNHLFDPEAQQQVIDVAQLAAQSGIFDG